MVESWTVPPSSPSLLPSPPSFFSKGAGCCFSVPLVCPNPNPLPVPGRGIESQNCQKSNHVTARHGLWGWCIGSRWAPVFGTSCLVGCWQLLLRYPPEEKKSVMDTWSHFTYRSEHHLGHYGMCVCAAVWPVQGCCQWGLDHGGTHGEVFQSEGPTQTVLICQERCKMRRKKPAIMPFSPTRFFRSLFVLNKDCPLFRRDCFCALLVQLLSSQAKQSWD